MSRIIETGSNAMEAMTRENWVQVSSFLAAFWSKAQKDGTGTTQFLLFAPKDDFIKAHRDVLVKLLSDYVHGIHVVNKPKNRPRALKIMAQLTDRLENTFADWALLPARTISTIWTGW